MAKTSDLILYGALAAGGLYLVYKISKPIAKIGDDAGTVSGSVANIAEGYSNTLTDLWKNIGDTAASGLNIPKTAFDKVSQAISNINTGVTPILNTNVGETDAKTNIITTITPNIDTAYGKKTVTVKSSSGKSSTVIAAPNTYYSNLGVGFDSKGQGYSSAFAGNVAPKTETVKTSTSNVFNTAYGVKL